LAKNLLKSLENSPQTELICEAYKVGWNLCAKPTKQHGTWLLPQNNNNYYNDYYHPHPNLPHLTLAKAFLVQIGKKKKLVTLL